MTLLTVGDCAVEFGATTLLDGVSFAVPRSGCWGVVGRNGAGKTTLFRLLTRELRPTRGAVASRQGLRIALLDQNRSFGDATTVWQAAAAGYREVLALESSLARHADRLAAQGGYASEADLTAYGAAQERFMHLGGYEFHSRVDAVLQGLGFDPDDAKRRPLETLSGGERGRVGLAVPLAAPADLLLLDEPTNHLDLDTIVWLTQYLHDQDETVLIISHDRAFLDDTVDHVLHVFNQTTTLYRGGYSGFAEQRLLREVSFQREFQKQQTVVAKEEEYIRRHIAGQNSAQAKGRRRRLDRLPRLSPPPSEESPMRLGLESGERGGDRVIQMENLTVQRGPEVLIRGATATAMRGEVIALVGPNGAGKSTLLATLLGEHPCAGGRANLGASIHPAWYRQDLAGVPVDQTIYEVIGALRPAWNRGQIQGYLGAFGFSGDAVQRSTTSLSGGERARVALAIITLSRANLLVLDEPTNHLDVESIEVLEDALLEYEGTVLLVSHDRAFLRELATRVWSLEDGVLHDYAGTFVEWETAQDKRRAAPAPKGERSGSARRDRGRKRQTQDQASRSDRKAAIAQVEVAAALVHQIEEAINDLKETLADPNLYQGDAAGARRAGELNGELKRKEVELVEAMEGWSEAETAWQKIADVEAPL